MHQLHLHPHAALLHISELHSSLIWEFVETAKDAPRRGSPLDLQVAMYIDGLANWVRANASWSFETKRYFGEEGIEVQKTRIVDLLPKANGAASCVTETSCILTAGTADATLPESA